ncbi:MAG: protein O-GlcNAcase [Spirochaetales bacterium]
MTIRRFRPVVGAPTKAPASAVGKQVQVSSRLTKNPEVLCDPITGRTSLEAYRITVEVGGRTATLEAGGPRSEGWARSTLEALTVAGTLAAGVYHDAPAFALRGLIEGYYGPPWTPEARLDLIRFAAHHRFNAFFYAPKNDPYHRERWRDLYPDEALAPLVATAEACAREGLDFWYDLGPGLSMCYSSEADLELLVAKFDQLRLAGVRHFGLLFDDVPGFQHQADAERFEVPAAAHAFVANQVFARLLARDPAVRLIVCPTEYNGKGDEPSISRLGLELDPRIRLFWTGPEICSRSLELADASLFARTTNRPVTYWDNYPVNDLAMAPELHLGPYQRRDPHLYRASDGLVANVMEYPEATKIALATIGDYLWNPEAYDAEESWTRALNEVVGIDEAAAFAEFADNSRLSCLEPLESPRLRPELDKIGFHLSQGRRAEARTVLEGVLARLGKAEALFLRGMTNQRLQTEIQPWIEVFLLAMEALRACRAWLSQPEGELGAAHSEAFARARKVLEGAPRKLFSDLLTSRLSEFAQT